MKKTFAALLICLVLPPLIIAGPAIDKSEHAARRVKLMKRIGNGIAVFSGAKGPTTGLPRSVEEIEAFMNGNR